MAVYSKTKLINDQIKILEKCKDKVIEKVDCDGFDCGGELGGHSENCPVAIIQDIDIVISNLERLKQT